VTAHVHYTQTADERGRPRRRIELDWNQVAYAARLGDLADERGRPGRMPRPKHHDGLGCGRAPHQQGPRRWRGGSPEPHSPQPPKPRRVHRPHRDPRARRPTR
jgi:hypothetical protein